MTLSENRLRRLCVFCGSSDSVDEAYLRAARLMGQALAERGLGLVYGGTRFGLMGALADAALEAGATAIGVVPHHFNTPGQTHAGLSELHVVGSMHERKARMAELADAFVALPGGYGTLEELFETLAWVQIGLRNSPIGVLNVQGYFDPLLALIEHAGRQGFIRPSHRSLLVSEAEPDRLLDKLGM